MKLNIILRKLHLYMALVAGLFMLLLGVTGVVLVFENEIDRLLNPQLFNVAPQAQRITLQAAVDAANKAYPQTPAIGIRVPEAPELSIEVSLKNGNSAFINPYNGAVLGARNREQSLARFVHVLHTRFLLGPTGEAVAGVVSVLTLLMALTGLVLWWPRKLFTVKRGVSWLRLNFDLHNALGLYSAIFLCVITLTGVLIAFGDTTDPWLKRLNHTPDPRPPQSTITQNPAPPTTLTLDDAVRIAETALPGAAATSINVPAPGKSVFRVLKKFPEDRTPAGRSRVHIDQYSGQVLLVENTRATEAGTRIVNLKRSLHTGDVLGWPTRICALLACITLVMQIITGTLIWWKPARLRAG